MPYGRSSSWNTEQAQGREEDLEDGELEDGEIDDPEEDVPPPTLSEPPVKPERKEEKLHCKTSHLDIYFAWQNEILT